MDWPLIVLFLLTLYLGYRGYRVGLWRAIERLASLLAGYLAAFLLTAPLAPVIESLSGLEGIAALLLASLSLLFGAALLVSLAFRAVSSLLVGGANPTPATRIGGAAIGTISGVLLAVIVIWVGGFLRDLYAATDSTAASDSPAATSRTAAVVSDVAGRALGKALEIGGVEPGVAELSSALMKSPDRILALAIRLSRSPELADLLGNPGNHPTLDSGDIDALMRLPAFQRLADKPDMRLLLTTLGGREKAADGELSRQLAERISDTWLRARAARRDPRVLQILADADFRRNLEGGNPLALINDSQLLELVQIVLSAEPEPAIPLDSSLTLPAAPAATDAAGGELEEIDEEPRKPATIYRWTDDSGRLIYSDKPRPQN